MRHQDVSGDGPPVEAGDGVLVERTLRGDATAFEALVRRYARTAHVVAMAVVKESADAEDVCQDAFVRALERLEDCRNPDQFGAWFLRIVRNRAHSVRRYLGVRDAAPLDALPLASGDPGPQRETERSQLREDLLEALDDLTEVQREVVLLHDLEGWKHREIGELLEIPEGTVRAHLFHARRALREHEAIRRSREG
ncbi:MAG TPA: sigma-70 family RNA polymerase sigma factor [Longimicrobiales bacterium]|nr:sigma-70 family RNA polymerase sigma factor [Longimicrobiales bacterium]